MTAAEPMQQLALKMLAGLRDTEQDLDQLARATRQALADISATIEDLVAALVQLADSADACTPNTLKPYFLDDLIGRIDDVTAEGP